MTFVSVVENQPRFSSQYRQTQRARNRLFRLVWDTVTKPSSDHTSQWIAMTFLLSQLRPR
jgi:hypothetical protein